MKIVKFLIESMMEQIRFVITEKYQFEKRYELKFLALSPFLEQSRPWGTITETSIEPYLTVVMFPIEFLLEEIKSVLTETVKFWNEINQK